MCSTGSHKFVLHSSMSMIARYCTEIWSRRTFSWRRATWSSSEISVSQESWATPNRRQRRLLVRHTISPLRSFRISHIALKPTFGPSASCSSKWAPFIHHSTRNLSISSPKRSSRVNIRIFLPISAKRLETLSPPYWIWTPRKGQTLTKFLSIQWFTKESKNFSMKRILRRSFPIHFCTAKTYSSNCVTRRRPKRNKRNRKSRCRNRWRSWKLMSTSRKTARTQKYSTSSTTTT